MGNFCRPLSVATLFNGTLHTLDDPSYVVFSSSPSPNVSILIGQISRHRVYVSIDEQGYTQAAEQTKLSQCRQCSNWLMDVGMDAQFWVSLNECERNLAIHLTTLPVECTIFLYRCTLCLLVSLSMEMYTWDCALDCTMPPIWQPW